MCRAVSEPWPTLLAFAVSVILLYLVQRWINQHIQGIGALLFDSADAGMTLLWFLLLPGIIIHELSHWLMARLLGLKTARFRIWPQTRGKEIILGSVEVQKSNPLLDSLVGLAPFLGGSLALLLIGLWAFDSSALGQAWERGAWGEVLRLLAGATQVADSWVWLYLAVAISNAMMPSPSDRASWRLVLIYVSAVVLILAVFGWWPDLPAALIREVVAALRTLTYAFGLTLAIDLVFALILWLLEAGLSALRGSKITYR